MTEYQPFLDEGDAPLDVRKWPARKPVPSEVTKWDGKTSGPPATVNPAVDSQQTDRAKEE